MLLHVACCLTISSAVSVQTFFGGDVKLKVLEPSSYPVDDVVLNSPVIAGPVIQPHFNLVKNVHVFI